MMRSGACRLGAWRAIEHYVAGLYLLPAAPVVAAMRDTAQPKAILLHIVRAASLPDEIPEQWRVPLRSELEHDPVARIRTAYGALDAGDRVWVRYAPGEGLSIAVNERVVARADSHALLDAMFAHVGRRRPAIGKTAAAPAEAAVLRPRLRSAAGAAT